MQPMYSTKAAGDQWGATLNERMQQTLRWTLAQACGSYSAASVLRAGGAAKKGQELDAPHNETWLLI